jgi:hypothetical protein
LNWPFLAFIGGTARFSLRRFCGVVRMSATDSSGAYIATPAMHRSGIRI